MKRRFTLIFILLLTVLIIFACGSKDIDKETLTLARGEYLELTYEKTLEGIILNNNGKSISFVKDIPEDNQ